MTELTRERIEEYLRTIRKARRPITVIPEDLEALCTLALRGMPKVEWKGRSNQRALAYGYELMVYPFGPGWAWAIAAHRQVLESQSSPTRTAAKAAAETALKELARDVRKAQA